MFIPEVDYDQEVSEVGDELEVLCHNKRHNPYDLVERRQNWQGHTGYTMSAGEMLEEDEEDQMNEIWRDSPGRRDETPDNFQEFHGYRSPSPAEPTEAKANSLRDDSEHSLSSPEGDLARFLACPDDEKYDCHNRDAETEDGESETAQGYQKSKSIVSSETDEDDDKDSQRKATRASHGLGSTGASLNFASDLQRDQYRLAMSDSALLQEALMLSARTEGYDSIMDEDEPVMDVLSTRDTQNEHDQRANPYSLRSSRQFEDERHRCQFGSVDSNAWMQRANGYNQTGGVGGASLNFATDSYFRESYYQGDMTDHRWRSTAESIRFLEATQIRCNLELPGMSGHDHTERSIGGSGIDFADADLIPDGIDPALMDPPLQEVSYVNRLPDEDVRELYDSVHHMSPLNKAENDVGIWTPQEPSFADDETLMMDILMDFQTQRKLYHEALPSICSSDGRNDFLIRIIHERVAGSIEAEAPMDVQA